MARTRAIRGRTGLKPSHRQLADYCGPSYSLPWTAIKFTTGKRGRRTNPTFRTEGRLREFISEGGLHRFPCCRVQREGYRCETTADIVVDSLGLLEIKVDGLTYFSMRLQAAPALRPRCAHTPQRESAHAVSLS